MAVSVKQFKTEAESWWCPGCGDFAVLAALQRALAELELEPHNVALVAGIGCSGKIGNYVNSYNFHVTHGRALPSAMGIKLANRNLTVIAAGGDGDGYGIGMGHLSHAIRRNMDITYVVMDNQVYGLTKGQNSPTSDMGFQTKGSPKNIESPVRPSLGAVSLGATYVAQGFSSDVRQLTRLIVEGIKHPGFALINAFSPCVTYNLINTYDWFRDNLVNLDEMDKESGRDVSDRGQALSLLREHDGWVRGLIYQDPNSQPMEDRIPGFSEESLATSDLSLPDDLWQEFLAEKR